MAQKRSSEKELIVSSGAAPARRKTATPRRPKATTAASVAPAAEEVPTAAAPTPYHPTHDEIAALAYSYWETRGCQGGCPEEDWVRAENELRSRKAASAGA